MKQKKVNENDQEWGKEKDSSQTGTYYVREKMTRCANELFPVKQRANLVLKVILINSHAHEERSKVREGSGETFSSRMENSLRREIAS